VVRHGRSTIKRARRKQEPQKGIRELMFMGSGEIKKSPKKEY
jgi:hypothetical protein